MRPIALAAIALLSASSGAQAATSALKLVLDLPGDAQRNIATYECDQLPDPIEVEYINAAPNFLAIIPIEDQPQIFVSVISGSGAQYVSGEYTWITKAANASLRNELAGPDAPDQLTCLERNEIP